jgi:hypothetical protein
VGENHRVGTSFGEALISQIEAGASDHADHPAEDLRGAGREVDHDTGGIGSAFKELIHSLKLRVFCFSLMEHRNLWVSISPESQKPFISLLGPRIA